MTRLWERGDRVEEAVLRLTVGRDPQLDLLLLPWDCMASAAHAAMLESIGVLTARESTAIRRELAAIAAAAKLGELTIAPEEEDGHTALENRLSERLGEAGRKIHAGRSRNDQVMAALRLWGRDAILAQIGGVLAVVGRLLDLADAHREVAMPGYSHTRQAMVTTAGHWLASWAECLLDDLPWLEAAFDHLDRSPLGSASGFGVALPLDREAVSSLLGFDRPQHNTLAVQTDRGKSEYLALGAAAAAATDLGRLAADLIWFSSDELRFVRLATAVTTGSSIMPQKRNPDVLELIRAGAARLRSRQAEVGAVYGPLAAGYHRDLQLTKEPFLEGMQSLVDMLAALGPVIDTLEIDARRCRQAILPGTGATDAVYERVAAGEPFRDAYRDAARDPAAAVPHDAADAWRRRSHTGAPGALGLSASREALAAAEARLERRQRRMEAAVDAFTRPPAGSGPPAG